MNIEETVRAILLHEWDPLSIRANRSLAAENDDYMPGVLRLIESKCSAAQLESHLETLEKGWGMIPAGPPGRRRKRSSKRSKKAAPRLETSQDFARRRR